MPYRLFERMLHTFGRCQEALGIAKADPVRAVANSQRPEAPDALRRHIFSKETRRAGGPAEITIYYAGRLRRRRARGSIEYDPATEHSVGEIISRLAEKKFNKSN